MVGIYSNNLLYSKFVEENNDGILIRNDFDLWRENVNYLLVKENKRNFLYLYLIKIMQ